MDDRSPVVIDLTAKKIHRSFSDIDAMYLWQHPSALLRLAVKAQSEMTSDAFLSRGGSLEQKIQEAIVGATFLSIFQRLVSPVMGRMARINEEVLDIEARTANGAICQFEITTAYPPGYRIREAYRNGSKPEIPQPAFAGEPILAEWVATTILNKTAKVEKKLLNRHLLVYQNIFGGAPDLRRLCELVSGVESIWASVWIISGVPHRGGVAILCNTHGFNWSTMEWLSYVNAQEGKGFSGFDIYLQ
jgi:hypothetical protein